MTFTLLGMIDIPGDPEEVHAARRYVRGLLGDAHPAVGDVELCASELVTNAVTHTDSRTVLVAVFGADHGIRVEVIDAGAAGTAPHVRSDPYSEHGHGMYLVDALTKGRWDTCADEAGRTTWCEVPIPVAPAVLVLTHWFDPTADGVVRALRSRGAEVFRCDAADFPQRLVMTANIEGGGWSGTLRTEHRSIDLAEVSGAYYRRPSRWDLPAGMSKEEHAWAASEARFGFGGLLSAAVPWLNHPVAIARAEYKPLQLHTAVGSGLRVLPTALTNDPQEAARFADRHHGVIVYKSLSGELVADGGEVKAIYTSALVDVEHPEPAIAGTAHLFQRRLTDKAYDVRVTAIDETLFAVAIHCDTPAGRLDWRRDYDHLRYEIVQVPGDVASGVRELMNRLELRFGALDFAVTTSGQWWFYEINPNGQWGWIEDATGLPIADSIAKALITPTGARS